MSDEDSAPKVEMATLSPKKIFPALPHVLPNCPKNLSPAYWKIILQEKDQEMYKGMKQRAFEMNLGVV